MSGVYVEDPLMRIVDVHWKKKKPDEFPPEPGTPDNYCGRYGWGAIRTGASSMAAYGPSQFPPMIGTFTTIKPNVGPAGEKYGSLSGPRMQNPVETMTAAPEGQNVVSLALWPSYIRLFTMQIYNIVDVNGLKGQIGWDVPMVGGELSLKDYTIDMEWQQTLPSGWTGEAGLAISHPFNGNYNRPTEPMLLLGGLAAGSGSYVYDFKATEWLRGDIHYNEGNQFDPGVGGPAVLWWMTRVKFGSSVYPWSATSDLLGHPREVGDYYVWEIIAGCVRSSPNA